MRSFTFSILFLCLYFLAPAQDLTGTWEGTMANRQYAKISIIRYNNTYIGFTYDEGVGFCKAHFEGTFNEDNQKLKGVNTGFIDRTSNHVLSRYNLDYLKSEGKEYLMGTLSDKAIAGFLLSLGTGTRVVYTKVTEKVDTSDYMRDWLKENATQTTEPAKPLAKTQPLPPARTDTFVNASPTAPVVTRPADPVNIPVTTENNTIIVAKNKRITDTISVIDIQDKELIIKVLDNGIVDGDTVSIIHNGRVIAEKLSVTAKAYEIKIPVSREDDRHEIVLVAHNLGSISPNTALILIETPTQQYRLTASTDLSKNVMIIFRYKE